MRPFTDLSEQKVLALALSHEEDARTYADFSEKLREHYPNSAMVFREMAAEEGDHRRRSLDLYEQRFGAHLPQVRRRDIKGAPIPAPVWQVLPHGIDPVRRTVRQMEADSSRFYLQAAAIAFPVKNTAPTCEMG
jgi:rubrerythrin